MTVYFGIYYEGRQYGAVLPEYKAMDNYKRMSACLKNLDLRLLSRQDVKLKAVQ